MTRVQIMIGSTALYDTAWQPQAFISELSGGWAWNVETVELVRAPEIKTYDRGLVKNELTFTVTRVWADHAAAVQAVFLGPGQIPRGGQVEIITTPPAGSATVLYLSQGKLLSVTQPKIVGCRTSLTYSIVGGLWQTTRPPNLQ